MTEPLLRGLVKALELARGTHTIEDVIAQIECNQAQLWEGTHAVMVTEIHQTPRTRVLHFWLAAGDLEEVIQLSRVAMEWGRSQGCTQATLAGRKGWERALKNEGWGHQLVVLGRDL